MKKLYILLFLLVAVAQAQAQAFITTWKTDNLSTGSSNATSITIPTTGAGYNYDVDWNNDGTFEQTGLTGSVTHDYGTAGTYTIAIRGAFPRIYFAGGGDKSKILDIKQWGNIAWTSMNSAFYGCNNMISTATDVPNLTAVTDMSYMFANTTVFNGPANINSWNVGTVTNMQNMFNTAIAFNQNIGSWNVSSVTNMVNMFYSAKEFNQNIGSWDVGKVTSMAAMFRGALAFNGNIGSWNVGAVIDMDSMFYRAELFNQNIGSWNVSNVTSMDSMFYSAKEFNQNIGSWNVGKVTDMDNMFNDARAFNQNIGSWNVGSVTYMQSMFSGALAFNGNIGSWDVGKVKDMSFMFDKAAAFNRNIGSWNVGAVTGMSGMFYLATAFNQNIGSWNVGAVTGMNSMFYLATAFDQNIGSWNVINVTDMNSMFFGATAFNQNIGSWNVGKVIYMNSMFDGATAFNQNIGSWNVINVINMGGMFFNATAFNQNIGSWNVGKVTNMYTMFRGATAFDQSLGTWGTKLNTNVNLSSMLNNCGMNTANYDATLAGFNTSTITNKTLGASGLKYCTTADRANLILASASGGNGWTITGDTASCTAEINIKGNGVLIANNDTASSISDHTDFGSTDVASGSVLRTFTIENKGNQALNLTGTPKVAISGTNATDFTVTIQPATSLVANTGSTTFEVSFNPSASGVRAATISIASDDTDENPYIFSIKGTGTGSLSTPNFEVPKFILYPNPIIDVLHIEADVTIVWVEIFNSLGQKIISTKANKIDISKLMSGVYFVKIEDENKNIQTIKVMK